MILAQRELSFIVEASDGQTVLVNADEETLTALTATQRDRLLTDEEWGPFLGDDDLDMLLHDLVDPDTAPGPMEVVSFRQKLKSATKRPKKLGRTPKKFEARILSLSEIPVWLDGGVERLKMGLPTVIEDPVPREALLQSVTHDLAQYGADEVRMECRRQGALVGAQLVTAEHLHHLQTSWTIDLEDELAKAKTEVLRKLKRRKLSDAKRRAAQVEALERRNTALAYRYARRAVNEAFATGRMVALHALAGDPSIINMAKAPLTIDLVVQTAILDKATCEECEVVDGEVTTFGSARQQELEPPYYRCLGGENCRCVQVAILSDDTLIEIADGEVEEQYDPDEYEP